MSTAIREPTTRKIRNRGWTPIRYRTEDEVRHGWQIERDERAIRIQLVGEDRARRLPLSEARFIEALS